MTDPVKHRHLYELAGCEFDQDVTGDPEQAEYDGPAQLIPPSTLDLDGEDDVTGSEHAKLIAELFGGGGDGDD